jgi:nucleoside-diphosphate-sugar epimerase
MPAQETMILGATGPAGSHLAAALNRRSIHYRASLRNPQHGEKSFVVAGDPPVDADAMDSESLARAIKGYRVVYDCHVFPNGDQAKYPLRARNLAVAAAKTGAKIVHVSNYWSFLPSTYLPLDEEHPREGGSEWMKYRREGEDVLLAGGACVVHLPELYGPLVHVGPLQRAIEGACEEGVAPWIGCPAVERSYAYAADAMEAVVRLSYNAEAFGRRWLVGGNGQLSINQLAEIVGAKLGRKVRVAAVGQLELRLRSIFGGKFRDALRMGPDYYEPITFNNRRLGSLIGQVPTCTHEQGLTRTLEWLERRRLVK